MSVLPPMLLALPQQEDLQPTGRSLAAIERLQPLSCLLIECHESAAWAVLCEVVGVSATRRVMGVNQ